MVEPLEQIYLKSLFVSMKKVALNIAKVRGKNFYVGAQELVTGRTAIISQTGAGKSWIIGVICE